MTAQILASELANLISESKRKNTPLRHAAERSLEELKGLRSTSDDQIAADLTLRTNFVTPFLIACGTKNAKYTGISIVCLQRLVTSRALPKSRLGEVLEAFREATSAGLDVQLKILQVLPSLLQNYVEELQGSLLAAALNVCTTLQASKNATVKNTAAATLQQLVMSVFEKVVDEDERELETPTVGQAPVDDGFVQIRAAAVDAYKIFDDICLLTEAHKPHFLTAVGIPETFGLELIESVLTNHADVFLKHREQAHILRTRVMPFIINSISEKQSFAVTVRTARILLTLLRKHLEILTTECEMALGLLTHQLVDQETPLWKRSLYMEVLRGIFTEASVIRTLYAEYDSHEDKRNILQDLVAALVRISTEKPSMIGLGSHSTVPVAIQGTNTATDQAILEASGVPGIISSSINSSDLPTGISSQWSTMRVPCIDQHHKTDPPSIPETYIYSLTLACVRAFSEGLANSVIPLAMPEKSRKKNSRASEVESKSEEPVVSSIDPKLSRERSTLSKKIRMPVNPLTLESHPSYEDVRICAGIVEGCWPAILAACSAFLYAALDQEYYRDLLKTFQKFTHVAGVLRMSTPRDAFLTTLGKAAVPPSSLVASMPLSTPPGTPTTEPSRIFSNPRGLQSVDSLASNSAMNDRPRQGSVIDVSGPSLNTRNLLCLRALLNLGIALGPTLDTAWVIILGTLQKADLVFFATSSRTPTTSKPDNQSSTDYAGLLQNFAGETEMVKTAADRLLESTTGFPNESFLDALVALCSLLGRYVPSKVESGMPENSNPSSPERTRSSTGRPRVHSLSSTPATQNQEDLFALSKLELLASINTERLIIFPPDLSGWNILSSNLVSIACSPTTASSVRVKAAEILVGIVLKAAIATNSAADQHRSIIQTQLLRALSSVLQILDSEDQQMPTSVNVTSIKVHGIILDGLTLILENCGETFVSGWDIAFDIIDSVFVEERGRTFSLVSPTTRSSRLTRSSYKSLQLICTDFLPILPKSCFLILVNTLYKFCTQDDDLNISLTTVSFFWALSDFISARTHTLAISTEVVTEEFLIEQAPHSDAALWMLLLLRLEAVATDERLELRKSAIQTLFRIFGAYGDRLGAEEWSTCLNSVLFRLLASIEARLQSIREYGISLPDKDRNGTHQVNDSENGWNETTVMALEGIMTLLADYVNTLISHSTFEESWKTLLDHFEALLAFEVMVVSTAVFKALRHILSKGNMNSIDPKNSLGDSSINLAWALWSKSLPPVKVDFANKHGDNQNYLVAYVSAVQEIHRLMEDRLHVEHVNRMLALLQETLRQAIAVSYNADIEHLTPLQSQVLETIELIRTDISGVPVALISQVAELVSMAFEPKVSTDGLQLPTHIALSKASMVLNEKLILSHKLDEDIYTSAALSASLTALAKPIVLKYAFITSTKTNSPWRQATTSALAILKEILPLMSQRDPEDPITQSVWTFAITIANGIMAADCKLASENTDTLSDEDFDIASFRTLKDLITPALGSKAIQAGTRLTYTESLFQNSLIHAPTADELPQSRKGKHENQRPNVSPLATEDLTSQGTRSVVCDDDAQCRVLLQDVLSVLQQHRRSRSRDPEEAYRWDMCFVCLDELFALTAVQASPGEGINAARAAAPYLILRVALILRAYIADQPIRGGVVQPSSKRLELKHVFTKLVELNYEPGALSAAPGTFSDDKEHLKLLHPWLLEALRVVLRDERYDQVEFTNLLTKLLN